MGLISQLGHSGTNKSGWIRLWLYASVSWETKTMHTKLIAETLHEVFTLKFICSYLHLLFIICIIYVQYSTKVFFSSTESYWTTGPSVK